MKTVLIGCSNVKVPALDIQVIGAEDKEYTAEDSGKTIIRDVFKVSYTEVACSVPMSAPINTSRRLNTSSPTVNASNDYDYYFCDSSSNNVTIVLDNVTTTITVVKTSPLNEVRVVHSGADVDDDSLGALIDYLSPKTVLFDGTNYWTK